MPKNVGTLTLDDLLARRDITPLKLGLDIIDQVITRDLSTWNRITTDVLNTFAVTTTDIRRRYGVSDQVTFQRKREASRAPGQKVITGAVVEFPLHTYQAAIGWTADFFARKSVSDLATTVKAVQRGHLTNTRNQLAAALYGASNYAFVDYRDTGVTIAVKRFVNADGAPIPDGPNGEVFNGASHTHYLFTNGLTNAGGLALVATVIEHHANPRPYIYINKADETAWRALTDFKPFTDIRLTMDANTPSPTQRLDPFKVDDHEIGLFGAAVVATKPWAYANYAVCLDLGDSTPKPLVRRIREGGDGGLSTVAENVMYPIQARFMESEFGFGVWERTAGAVYYYAGGAVAYVEPAVVAAAATW